MKTKKIITICIVMMMQMITVAYASDLTVNQTKSNVLVNGTITEFEAYLIEGNNYFKLRDIAKVVSGTDKQFEVTWDNKNKRINLVSSKSYTDVGGELAKGDDIQKIAIPNESSIYKDGALIENLKAYTINGNNFFELRDLTQEFNIAVDYDAKTKAVSIDTKLDYLVPSVPVVVVPSVPVVETPSVATEPAEIVEPIIVTDSKTGLKFDIKTGTITGYTGTATSLIIP